MSKKSKSYKKVPNYWWDLEDPYVVIVESDHKDFPVVAEFFYDPMKGNREIHYDGEGGKFRQGCAAGAIEKAEQYIKDLQEGRETPKKIKRSYK